MPIILALLSSLVWGLADFLGGTLSKKRKAIAVIGGSQSFGLLFASTLALIFGLWTWDSTVWVNGAIAGAMGLLGLVGFYTALATGQMGIVAPISSLSAVVPVTIVLVQGERPGTLQVVGIVVALIGVILASGPELNGKVDPRPVFLALFAAVTFGICVYFMAKGGQINPKSRQRVYLSPSIEIWFYLCGECRSTPWHRPFSPRRWTQCAPQRYLHILSDPTIIHTHSMPMSVKGPEWSQRILSCQLSEQWRQ